MRKSKSILTLFIVFPVFLFLQFAYGMIVREPFPSFIMPGFSKIETQNGNYKLVDKRFRISSEDGSSRTIELNEFARPFSKIAMSRMIDNTLIANSSTHNVTQKKYYDLITKVVGQDFYQKNIVDARNKVATEDDQQQFKIWLRARLESQFMVQNEQIYLERFSVIRNFNTGELVKEQIIDSIPL